MGSNKLDFRANGKPYFHTFNKGAIVYGFNNILFPLEVNSKAGSIVRS